MKPILILCTLILVALFGCTFNSDTKKDPNTNLSVAHKGLSYGTYVLSVNKEPLQKAAIKLGEKVSLQFFDVTGFKVEGGRVYPGMSLTVTNDQGEEVSSNTDLLAYTSREGLTPIDAQTLSATFALAAPQIVAGKKYILHIRIWDKKAAGELTATLPFEVLKNVTPGLKTIAGGLTADAVFITSEAGRLDNNEVKLGSQVGIDFIGIKGFIVKDGRVFPGGRISIYGKDGKLKHRTKNLFAKMKDGIRLADAQSRLSLLITLDNEKLRGEEGEWHFKIWDTRSEAEIEAVVLLKLK
jgi:hypothetical protein